jgi:CRP/FNR family transcriptional regulator
MAVQAEALRSVPLFATLAHDDLALVARVTVERSYIRGDIIILAGQTGGALYYVHSGLVKVYKTSDEGKEQALRLIGAGATFNDVPALDGGPNPASVMAMEPTTVYATSGEQLRRLIVERPGVAAAAVRTLTSALRYMITVVEDLSFRHVRARIAKLLLDQDEENAKLTNQPPRHLTQQEMAAMAGTAREVVGRALKELEMAGAVRNDHGRLTVLSRERLQMLSS